MAKARTMADGKTKEVSLPHQERRASRKHLRRLSVERATNGGYTVNHDYNQGQGPYVESDAHAFGADDHEGVLNHIKKHLGINRRMAATAAAAGGDHDGDEA